MSRTGRSVPWDVGKEDQDRCLSRLHLDVGARDYASPSRSPVVGYLTYHVGYFDAARPFVLPGIPSFDTMDDCRQALDELQSKYDEVWPLRIMSRTLGHGGVVRWEVADGDPAPEWRTIEEPLNWLVDEDDDDEDDDEDEG